MGLNLIYFRLGEWKATHISVHFFPALDPFPTCESISIQNKIGATTWYLMLSCVEPRPKLHEISSIVRKHKVTVWWHRESCCCRWLGGPQSKSINSLRTLWDWDSPFDPPSPSPLTLSIKEAKLLLLVNYLKGYKYQDGPSTFTKLIVNCEKYKKDSIIRFLFFIAPYPQIQILCKFELFRHLKVLRYRSRTLIPFLPPSTLSISLSYTCCSSKIKT